MNGTWVRRLNRWASRLSPAALAAVCGLTVAAIGAADYATGYELAFSIFYVAPVAFGAWYGGVRIGQETAVLSALVWMIADLSNGHPYSHLLIPAWNATARLGFFAIIGRLMASLRSHLEAEKRLARVDPVTGVMNSRAFTEEAQRAVSLAARARHPLSLVYFDLDDFKSINDVRGHKEGDRLLKRIGETLIGAYRPYDLVARLGGDEFAVLLPNTDAEESRRVVQRTTEALTQAMRTQSWPVTFSVGVVTFRGAPPSVDEAIHLADQAMYKVKTAGKNNAAYEVWDGDTAGKARG